jgi:hypothetical protein
MGVFDGTVADLAAYRVRWAARGELRERRVADRVCRWPAGGPRNLVFGGEVAVELGHPHTASAAFCVWNEAPGGVRDGLISVLGPEPADCPGARLPFGKAVLVAGRGFSAANSWERSRELAAAGSGLDLEGVTLRSASRLRREWIRVGRSALVRGFSFAVLGEAVQERVRRLSWVEAAEVLFVTASREAVLELDGIAAEADRICAAMGKMSAAGQIDLDCGTCEHAPVCDAVGDLKRMRDELRGGPSRGRETPPPA